jgi:hypothetical protein
MKICLVIDLDETLVHSSFKPVPNADFIVPVEIDGQVHQVNSISFVFFSLTKNKNVPVSIKTLEALLMSSRETIIPFFSIS